MKSRSMLFLIFAGLILLFIFFGKKVLQMVKGVQYAGAPSPYDDIIQKYADQYSLDPNLIRAVIQQESNWDESVMGFDGLSVGLMQITLPLASDFFGRPSSFDELADPDINIHIGAWYLSRMINKYGLVGGLASYNEGPGNWAKGIHDQAYTDSVQAYYQKYIEASS